VVIAAITSCTNTSNPSVMVAAGLLARKAVERGLDRKEWVKTSMAPGSRVVTRYLEAAGLMPYLQALGFHVVGYGCTTCIGNSGPLAEDISRAVVEDELVVAAVLSGNRNFEGRINPLVRASYLASPALVVAYALAGTVDIDLTTEPIGTDPNGQPVYLSNIWPTQAEVASAIAACLDPEMYRAEYAHIFRGDAAWNAIASGDSMLFPWRADSTYVRLPPFFEGVTEAEPGLAPIRGARCLVLLGDSITTDHISPAGAIAKDSPAGAYLMAAGVAPADFNSYGSRRGNHEVMMRGTFANVRLKNLLLDGVEGPWTRHFPTGEQMTIFDAAERYRAEGTPLLVIAGKEYGSGSSRDWAAKGPSLLGVRIAIAESYERIHRSNLIGMGILPLQFLPGESAATLGISGTEAFDVHFEVPLRPQSRATIRAVSDAGAETQFGTVVRADSPVEVRYLENGGILHTVLRDMMRAG
jgi:aconitate hydratase